MYIDTKKVWIIVCAFFLLFIFYHVAIAEDSEDWAFYESEAKAREIYNKKIIQIPCARIDDLLRKNDSIGVYIAIRDAALFGDKTCETYIKKYLRKLKKLDGAKDVIAFYSYKNGDQKGLKLLAGSFDKDLSEFAVDLFGFINEWQISGRRLVRFAKCCHDASGGELLCNAISWRRYLYGEDDFKRNWFKIGKEEKVSLEILQHFYDKCRPE
jgi:hypothetical protein